MRIHHWHKTESYVWLVCDQNARLAVVLKPYSFAAYFKMHIDAILGPGMSIFSAPKHELSCIHVVHLHRRVECMAKCKRYAQIIFTWLCVTGTKCSPRADIEFGERNIAQTRKVRWERKLGYS